MARIQVRATLVAALCILLPNILPLINSQRVPSLPDSDDVPTSQPGCHPERGKETKSEFEGYRGYIPRSVSTERDVIGSQLKFLGTCTEEEYYNWYYNEYDLKCRYLMGNRTFDEEKYFIYCNKECGTPYLQFLRSCAGSVGEVYADYYKSLCHENSNGVPCAYFFLAAAYLQPAYYVLQNCQLPYYANGSSCSLECFVSLHEMKYQMGCCVNNIYNHSSLQNDLASYGLWNNCGVSTPGFCSGVQSLALSSLTLTAFIMAIACNIY